MAVTLLGSLLACGAGEPSVAEGGQCRIPAETPSVARAWNDVALDAIRLDFPAPTVHARNLFHLSAAMWDVWSAYDEGESKPLFVDEKRRAERLDAARIDAISFASHHLLRHRYDRSLTRDRTLRDLDAALEIYCRTGDADGFVAENPDSAAAFGVFVARHVIEATLEDGARERDNYEDPDYKPVNEPLVVVEPGASLADPDRWQPLVLERALSQNGLPLAGGRQEFIGSHWGAVQPFSLPASNVTLPNDPGGPPRLSDEATAALYVQGAVEVLEASATLCTGTMRADFGPGTHGNNPLAADTGQGHALNPSTGEMYAPNEMDFADWARAIAEYWADGPTSETPPGHWNVLMNEVSDALPPSDLLIASSEEAVDRLEWDVKLALAVNGALHDAAIAAWATKAHYDSVRPISMIRYLGGNGQSSDPSAVAYDPHGLPLRPGLIEVVTNESAAPGERHDHLASHVGEIAVFAWKGSPRVPELETSCTGWIRAVEWVPYQRPTFVTPAFASYVSGHSTFSRAAAEVLAGFTGSEFFPGGLASHRIRKGTLFHEEGPSEDVELQWATFFDASDEAGRSRIYGGIHIVADDYDGRILGSEVGRSALKHALSLF